MKRSIVQQGPTTMMISLPIKWVRKYGLSKGDELDIDELGRKLIVSTEKKVKGAKTEIKIDSENELYIWRSLQPLYILGYDEIKIYFSSSKTLDTIQKLISSLIGFEVTDQEKDHCIIKAVSSELDEQFSNILRRAFLNLLRMSEITLAFLEKREDLSLILNLELTNNRHTMFLKRLLVKEGYEDVKKIPFVYSLVVFLERIANEYKFLTWYAQDKKNIKISKEMIAHYKKLHKEIKNVYNIFYSYDAEKVKEVILKDIRVEQIKPLFKQDPEIAYYFMKMTDLIRAILSQVMGIRA